MNPSDPYYSARIAVCTSGTLRMQSYKFFWNAGTKRGYVPPICVFDNLLDYQSVSVGQKLNSLKAISG